ncbi:WUSCHEL-related homeobox 9-like [Salvia hispanica]|uniref:WUSCHEL-related homeobox 9-like n=1 Tax=Salvia hispanica TaxID=49212 RepID=UPI002009C944|nr:WUSCHEL-related homeobox 9-like [Salvia hispanica]
MTSSNKHWPSMFKSKPTHDMINSSLTQSNKGNNLYIIFIWHGCDERTPEPKARWNPRPEQIRILETIFNSGMVNPPRDEIRRIRARLQEYGQVGDANVFYWFQNRKSRSKHKQRRLQTSTAPPSLSSSSSDKSSGEKSVSVTVTDLINSPTGSVNQPILAEPFHFPAGQGVCFPAAEQNSSFLLNELMMMSKKNEEHTELTMPPNPSASFFVPSPTNDHLLQGVEERGPTKSTVFINDVCFEVAFEPFNVRAAFGDDAVLFHSTGQPVMTDGWGVTLHPLHHGGVYYLLRPFMKI